MKPFAYERPTTRRGGAGLAADPAAPSSPAAPTSSTTCGSGSAAPTGWSTSPGCRSTEVTERADGGLVDRRRRPQQRPRRPPAGRAAATRSSPRRWSPARPASCATWPRPAATCCSAPGASTSRTSRRRATSASPAAAARPSRASAATTRSSATSDALRRHAPLRPVRRRWPRSTPRSSCVGAGGERRIPFGDFHRLPGDRPDLDTTLEPGELVLAVELPPLAFAVRSRYRKVRERASYAFALVSVAAALDVRRRRRRATYALALGGVSHRPHRATVAEEALRGAAGDARARSAAAIEAELAAAARASTTRSRCRSSRNTVVDVLTGLAGRGARHDHDAGARSRTAEATPRRRQRPDARRRPGEGHRQRALRLRAARSSEPLLPLPDRRPRSRAGGSRAIDDARGAARCPAYASC